MKLLSTLAVTTAIALLVFANFVTTNASPFYGGTGALTLVATPAPLLIPIGCCFAAHTLYRNNLNINVTGIVYAVLRNGAGQTLSINAATLIIPAGGNSTCYVVINAGPPTGTTVSLTFFVTLPSGTAISTSELTVLSYP
jgi:hypothetical protein